MFISSYYIPDFITLIAVALHKYKQTLTYFICIEILDN